MLLGHLKLPNKYYTLSVLQTKLAEKNSKLIFLCSSVSDLKSVIAPPPLFTGHGGHCHPWPTPLVYALALKVGFLQKLRVWQCETYKSANGIIKNFLIRSGSDFNSRILGFLINTIIVYLKGVSGFRDIRREIVNLKKCYFGHDFENHCLVLMELLMYLMYLMYLKD